MMYCETLEMKELEMDPTEKTAKVLEDMMNTIARDMTFTTEIAKEFLNKRLPTLDVELWVEERPTGGMVIMHSFFKKPMASRYSIMEKSAMSWESKKASLTQEVIRRSMNMCLELSMKERLEVLQDFINQLERSGYNLDQRREIFMSGLKGYENKVARARDSSTKMYRSMKQTTMERRRDKMISKVNWFKGRRSKTLSKEKEATKRQCFKHTSDKETNKPFRKEAIHSHIHTKNAQWQVDQPAQGEGGSPDPDHKEEGLAGGGEGGRHQGPGVVLQPLGRSGL